MKLSARSRYGTRMMVDLAQNYDKGPIRLSSIAGREGLSRKYLEQLIIPLKKNGLIKSFRGPKGGHILARPPGEISVGEIVKTLEENTSLTACIDNPEMCDRTESCPTRRVWTIATTAMFNKLNSISLTDIITKNMLLDD
jgi:Rrf2 family protein